MTDNVFKTSSQSNLYLIDWIVIACYFGAVIIVGIWSSRRKNRNIGDYFLASKNMHWILVGSSLFASNIGSGHFIGLAGSAASSGIGVAGFELIAAFALMELGWLFVPVYLSSDIFTMPEYLRERFGGQRIRIYLAFLSLLLYIFTKISADLYAGALFIQIALNRTSTQWLYISIFILLAVAAIFTITGGLTAVLWTDFIQTILMIIGSLILMGFSFVKIGGFRSMVDKFPSSMATIRAGNGSCGVPPSDYMNLLRSPVPGASDLPWTGMTLCMLINSTWYWCTDQVIVQRSLASKNLTHAKAGCVLASFLKLLPLWLIVFPGMVARILFPDTVACADPEECMMICGSPGGCSNMAYAELVINLLPKGLCGMMLAVMMAALMSSLTSIFNSSSTIFTIDIWTRFRKNASDLELVIVGRIFVIVLVIISIVWIPIIQNSGNSRLFDYVNSISSFLAPPVCAVYLLAVFWPRANEQGAFWGLMIGLFLGLFRFALEFFYVVPSCGSDELDTRPAFIIFVIDKIHYLHYGLILFIISGSVAIIISLLTKPIPEDHLYRLTFWTRKSTQVKRKWKLRRSEKARERKFSLNETNEENKNAKTTKDEPSLVVKILFRLFGYENDKVQKEDQQGVQLSTKEENDEIESTEMALDDHSVLYENPKWKTFVNCCAIITICITVFTWGYFA